MLENLKKCVGRELSQCLWGAAPTPGRQPGRKHLGFPLKNVKREERDWTSGPVGRGWTSGTEEVVGTVGRGQEEP